MSNTRLALSFRIFRQDQLVREVTLTQGVIKIGKVPSAHLQLADESVSRMHAVIEVGHDEVTLIDLGSTRGTFVNGKRINKATLRTGDAIALGDTRLELAIGEAVPVLSVVPPPVPATMKPATPPELAAVAGVIAPRSSRAVARSHIQRSAAVDVDLDDPVIVGNDARDVISTAPARRRVHGPDHDHGGVHVHVHGHDHGPDQVNVNADRSPPPSPSRIDQFRSAAAQGSESPGGEGPPRAGATPLFASTTPVGGRRTSLLIEDAGSAGAVEVAAMLGDTVLDVKHCMDPRGGKPTVATWILVAGGAACLLAAAIAFTSAVRTAADDKERFEAWTRVEHRPGWAFRPVRSGTAAEGAVFGGLALGLIGLTWGLLRMRRERTSPYYRIGTAPGVEHALEHAPLPAFPLVAPSGDDFVFNYGAGIDGELIVGGASTPFSELAGAGRARPSASVAGAVEIPLSPNARIRARAGKTTFLISAVARPRRHAAPVVATLERRVLGYIAGSLAVHLGLLALFQALPPEALSVNVDTPLGEDPTMRLRSEARLEAPPPKPDTSPDGDTGGKAGEGDRPAMALPSGKTGNPSAEPLDARRQLPDNPQPGASPESRDALVEDARHRGILASDAFASLDRGFGPTGGFDQRYFDGPLYGVDGQGPGSFGNDRSGFNLGGGCFEPPCGTIPGHYATISVGPHAGDFYGIPGHDPFHPRPHRPELPRLLPPEIKGGYDKQLIRRYIRRHIDQLSYCYEKQLLAHPSIEGEVAVTFMISAAGAVQSTSATGFDPEVASCLAGVIKAIEFPATPDGTGVQVNYPFHFHAPS